MKVLLECLSCSLRQVLEAARMATGDPAEHTQIMDEAIELLTHYHEYPNSPAVAQEMHRIVKAHTGNLDPYVQIKQRDLALARGLMPDITRRVQGKADALYWSLKASATGNVLDSAIYADYENHHFDEEFEAPFAICDLPAFKERLQTAKSLLVIGDNTGETVFDCLLLKQFPHLTMTYAVRSAPVINDATMAEAIEAGIDQYAEVISTGCAAPGVMLEACNAEFLEIFHAADLVISKGQGNYETLSDAPRSVFFLLKAKCPVIANALGVHLNDYIFQYHAS